ncbi:MAG: hypothetical protein IT449_01915 [Phycisphaerales bacterium]|nr:hypothetical protein [Phycisphaerales bacterium]
MTIEQIRKAVIKAEPFRPFTLSLGNGRRCFVPHPEFIWVLPEASRTLGVAGDGEDYSIMDLLLVTSIDFGNGATRKRSSRRKQ